MGSHGANVQDAGRHRCVARRLDHDLQRAEGHHRRRRMPVESAATRGAGSSADGEGRQARHSSAVRHRSGFVYRGPFMHPPRRVSFAHHKGQPGSIAARSDRSRGQQLCRLRSVRRSGPRGGAVSLLLQSGCDQQPERLGSFHVSVALRSDRIFSAPLRSAPGTHRGGVAGVSAVRPITVTISALGGQGGGVVSDWLVDIGRRAGHLVQATSVPGVAQRTGATIYYLEFFPLNALPADGRRPVFALMPNPGDVDILVASEIMEAGRAMQRGLVTSRTTLIASSHRIYAIDEKSKMGDGRADATQVRALAREHSKRFIEFDMQAMAEAHGSVISAVMLGALCGSGALPFAADLFLQAIRASGIAVDSSVAAFEAARQAAAASGPVTASGPVAAPVPATALAAQKGTRAVPSLPKSLDDRIGSTVPAGAQEIAREGVKRMIDYQDVAYAGLYLDRLDAVIVLENADSDRCALTMSVARGLALWMSFEDPIRVADLKIRSARARRVLDEVVPKAGQLVQVT